MRIAVIGGGIVGSLVSLGLADRGVEVTLVDRRDALMHGATFAGEGKIHLGYVYGLGDHATVAAMLNGAMSFDRSLESLVGRSLPWHEIVSTPFRYLVHHDSLISPDDFERHANRLSTTLEHMLGDTPSLTYLGQPLTGLEVERDGAPHTFITPERSVDMSSLSDIISSRVTNHHLIDLRLGHHIDMVDRNGDRWHLGARLSTGSSDAAVFNVGEFDAVVNCAWDGAAALDARAGFHPTTPSLRLRTFVHAHTNAAPTAVTIALGPFGDVVIFPGGRMYASWYPTGLLAFEQRDAAPPSWDDVVSDPEIHASQVRSTISSICRVVGELGDIENPRVHARVVVAHGSTDIDDPGSGLHQRGDADHVVADNWYSVRSTKLTTAPLAALNVVRAICGATP